MTIKANEIQKCRIPRWSRILYRFYSSQNQVNPMSQDGQRSLNVGSQMYLTEYLKHTIKVYQPCILKSSSSSSEILQARDSYEEKISQPHASQE